jgi:hypothetical protein
MDDMVRNHPIRKAVLVLRSWLVLVAVMMTWNAFISNPILLTGWMRPVPFFFFAALALIWAAKSWSSTVVILCSSALTVGMFLRALEVTLYADQYNLRARFTGASIWLTIGGTAVAFGILNVLVVSRRQAEDWVWSEKSSR